MALMNPLTLVAALALLARAEPASLQAASATMPSVVPVVPAAPPKAPSPLPLLVDRRSAEALAKAGRKMLAKGRYLQAEPLLEKRLWRRQAEETTTTHAQLGEALIDLADLYTLEGRLPEAESAYDQAYDVLRPDLGLEHPSVLRLQDHMAELYRRQGRQLRS